MTATSAFFDRRKLAISHISSRILRGELGPGIHLDSTMLAKEIGVSITPVREAMSALEIIGVVEHMPRLGMLVRRMSAEDVADLFELRELHEGFAAARVAERIEGGTLDKLRRHCQAMRDCLRSWRRDIDSAHIGGITGLLPADLGFHHTIICASGNRQLVKIFDNCQILTRICQLGAANDLRGRPFYEAQFGNWIEHMRIYHAIRRRDTVRARRLMETHIADAKKRFLARYVEPNLSVIAWPKADQAQVANMETLD